VRARVAARTVTAATGSEEAMSEGLGWRFLPQLRETTVVSSETLGKFNDSKSRD
jgi:hypothetical protein